MKSDFLNKVLTLTCWFVGAAHSAAAGGLNGGGVDVVVNPRHDEVVLADPYGIPVGGLPATYKELFSKEIQIEVEKLILLMTEAVGPKPGEKLRKLMTNGDIEFYVVKELPPLPECMRKVTYQGLEADDEIARAACTVGNSTWIVDDLFRRLSTGGQAVALAHEGFRRLSPVAGDPGIFRLVSGLSVALAHINLQEAGDFRTLTTNEMVRMKDFVRMSWKMTEFSDYTPKSGTAVEDYISHLEIWPLGGGIIYKDKIKNVESVIDPTAKIGVGQQIYADSSRIGAGSMLWHTALCKNVPCHVGRNAYVLRTQVGAGDTGQITLGDDVALINSVIPSGESFMGNNVVVINTLFQRTKTLKLGNSVRITNSTVEALKFQAGFDVDLRESVLKNDAYSKQGLIRLGNHVNITGLEMTFGYHEPPASLVLVPVVIGLAFTPMIWMEMDKNMHFLDGFTADFTGQKICPEGKAPRTAHWYNLNYEFKNIEDIQSYCVSL